MVDYAFHPIAGIFDLMQGYELDSLTADIQKNGLREPVLLFEGKVADGRNRYRACKAAKVNPRFEEYGGSEHELLQLIISRNLHRRHLNESQRAMAAVKIQAQFDLLDKKRGSDAKVANLPPAGKSRDEAAKLLNVSPRSVQTAKKVIEQADPAVSAAVASGEVAVSDAVKIVDLPKSEQKAAVKKVKAGKAKTLAKAVSKEVAAKKKPKGGINDLKDKARKAIGNVCRCFDALGIYEEFKDVLQDLQNEVQKVRG